MRVRKIIEVEVEGLGRRIFEARKLISDRKSLASICESVGVSKQYWYDLEKERLNGTLSIENLRKIETELETSFEVEIDGY